MRTPLLLVACVILSVGVNGIDWQPGDWAMRCDFNDNDLTNEQIRGEDCGGRCWETKGCTHFAWSTFNGGTCWMKSGSVSKDDAIDNGDQSMVCGVVNKDRNGESLPNPTDPREGDALGPIHRNVLATRHVNGGSGDACALPQASYAVTNPFALGNVRELGDLGFKPDLCGHVFRIDCGRGALDIIATNSNLGGGLDLYSQTSWPKATGNAPPGQTKCSVQLSDRNALSGGSFQCFYKPGTETNNAFFRNIGILNIGSKIVTGAKLKKGGQAGNHAGPNPYYAFGGRSIDVNEEVVFSFNDGSSHTVRFRDCKSVRSEQSWR